MKKIKEILDEISSEPSTNKKMEILSNYKDNETLLRVLYLAKSKRIKFYIKQIPDYVSSEVILDLDNALINLTPIYERHVTGHDAINLLRIILETVHPDDAIVISRIVDRNLKIGMGSTNINKIIPSLVEKTPYLGAKPFDEVLVKKLFYGGKEVYSQLKADGRYCNAIIRNGDIFLESRQGEQTILNGAMFLTELEKFDDCVLNGELIMKNTPRYISNGIIASLISIFKKQDDGDDVSKEIKKFEEKHMEIQKALELIEYSVWDTITIEEYFAFKSDSPYITRLNNLHNLVEKTGSKNVSVIEYKMVKSHDEAMEHFVSILKRNLEGTILKSKDGVWKNGKPNSQIKVKKEINYDLKITGFNYGTGKNTNRISSINVESLDGLLRTSPTGMTEDIMDFVTENQNNLIGKILEIKCSGISFDSDNNYSVLHPVFLKIRDDKTEANSLEECIEIDKAAAFI